MLHAFQEQHFCVVVRVRHSDQEEPYTHCLALTFPWKQHPLLKFLLGVS